MTSLLIFNRTPRLAAQLRVPATRGPMVMSGHYVLSKQRLSTDSIGNFALTLTNLVVGSVVQVETLAGAAIENRAAASTTEAFNVPAYSPGSSSNNLRIKVRKGSGSPYYIPWETLAVASVGAQSIYVSQIPDE